MSGTPLGVVALPGSGRSSFLNGIIICSFRSPHTPHDERRVVSPPRSRTVFAILSIHERMKKKAKKKNDRQPPQMPAARAGRRTTNLRYSYTCMCWWRGIPVPVLVVGRCERRRKLIEPLGSARTGSSERPRRRGRWDGSISATVGEKAQTKARNYASGVTEFIKLPLPSSPALRMRERGKK